MMLQCLRKEAYKFCLRKAATKASALTLEKGKEGASCVAWDADVGVQIRPGRATRHVRDWVLI